MSDTLLGQESLENEKILFELLDKFDQSHHIKSNEELQNYKLVWNQGRHKIRKWLFEETKEWFSTTSTNLYWNDNSSSSPSAFLWRINLFPNGSYENIFKNIEFEIHIGNKVYVDKTEKHTLGPYDIALYISMSETQDNAQKIQKLYQYLTKASESDIPHQEFTIKERPLRGPYPEYNFYLILDKFSAKTIQPADFLSRLKKTCQTAIDVRTVLLEGITSNELQDILGPIGRNEKSMFDDRTEMIDDLNEALLEAYNIVLQGPPGTGKTWTARKMIERLIQEQKDLESPNLLDHHWSSLIRDNDEADTHGRINVGELEELGIIWDMVQLHPGYSYEDFVRGMTTGDGSENGGISFVPKDRIMLELTNLARNNPDLKVILILDEINRCNLASVLGELILVLEPDKRSGRKNAGWPVRLQYPSPDSKGEVFTMPDNLYLIGTMNTADRSIAMIDYAIRRRFRFIDIVPDAEALRGAYQAGHPKGQIAVKAFEHFQNQLPELESGLRIGHTYFITENDQQNDIEVLDPRQYWLQRLARKIAYEVVPLLREYRAEGRPGVGTLLQLDDECSIKLTSPENLDSQREDVRKIADWLSTLEENQE